LQNVLALFFQSMFACMMQDIGAAEAAATQAMELCGTLKQLTSDPDLHVLADGIRPFFGIFGPFAWVIKAQNEGRFSAASERVKKLRQDLELSLERLDASASPALRSNEGFQVWSQLLTAYKWVLIETEDEIRVQCAAFQGQLNRYRKGLRDLALFFDKAAEAVQHPSLQQFKTSLRTLAEQRRARAELFELQPLRFLVPPAEKKIFLIHGRDEGAWRALKDLLLGLGWAVVELAGLPSGGMTIIEKLEHYALDCSYALGLFTPDDFVKEEGKDYAQARPNVLLELGWFYGRYGRGHATIVCKKGTAIPSDLQGILRAEYLERVEEVREELRRELEAAQPVDAGGDSG
jgi:predicted nucleotide-binding protein